MDRLRQFRSGRTGTGTSMALGWIYGSEPLGFAQKSIREAELLLGAPEEQEALDSAMRDIELASEQENR